MVWNHFLERAEGVLPSPQLLFSTSIEYVSSSQSWARWVVWWLLRLLSWSKLNVNAHSPVFTAYLEHEHGPADDLWTIRPVGWTLELLNLDINTFQLNIFLLKIYKIEDLHDMCLNKLFQHALCIPFLRYYTYRVVFQSLMFICAIVQSKYFTWNESNNSCFPRVLMSKLWNSSGHDCYGQFIQSR